MPIIDGFESPRKIRGFERDTQRVRAKIIALTGLGSLAAQQEAARSCIDLFLPKPVSMEKLKGIIDEDFWRSDMSFG